MRIVVLGYIIRGPFGGMSWHHLHYILGLKVIGHEVLFLEDSDSYPSCYDPVKNEMTSDPSYGLNYIRVLFEKYDLHRCWAYYNESTHTWYNRSATEVMKFCGAADIVINLSAVNPLREWWQKIPVKVFVDTDPLFTQVKSLGSAAAASYLQEHTHFFSFGENIGKPYCGIPTLEIEWRPTRQPIYLPAWRPAPQKKTGKWTTVMNWDSYHAVTYSGKTFGMKSLSFNEYYNLPLLLQEEQFELAIGGANIPEAKLNAHSWGVVNPLEVIPGVDAFQQYINESKGEWSVAKHGYVEAKTGWFSERTLNYMAAGKPVVVQDTGFTEFLPTGKGLIGFSSPKEVVESIKQVNADYNMHAKAARRIVEDHFESTMVLQSLLNKVI
jgi:hypothetical protein